MTAAAKPTRAPSEEALETVRITIESVGYTEASPGWILELERHMALTLDAFAAHRLSTALPVVEAARRHVRSFEPGTLSGSELSLACELRDMDGDIWDPWCVPGELVPMTDAEFVAERLSDALLNPSEEVVCAGVQAYLDCRSVNLNTAIERVLRASAMKITGQ